MGLFDLRVPYKPFEYPEFNKDGWFPQTYNHWVHTSIPMQSDVKNWNEHLTESERHLVGNILKGFAQTECAVSDYWSTYVTRWFPKHEIKEMAMAFGYFETIHAQGYSYLNEELGLTDFEAFLHDPAIADKFELLTETSNDYTYEDLKVNPEARVEVARSLAIFSSFAEGVSLYSSFAVLYSFQMRNLLKGIGQQMVYSVADESLHSKMGCLLFRKMCEEYPELKEQARESIAEAANLIVELEEKFIDKMFEQGDLDNLRAYDLKQFIRASKNVKITELGYTESEIPNFNYDEKAAENLEWFYHLTGGLKHTDFFAGRVTDYGKVQEKENLGDAFSFLD